jgi:hypothetical protein
MGRRKLNNETPNFVNDVFNTVKSNKPCNSHNDIMGRKDRIAAQIIECMRDFTWQEATDQLDFVKYFLMNRIIITSVSFDNYLEIQKLKSQREAWNSHLRRNNDNENKRADAGPASTVQN